MMMREMPSFAHCQQAVVNFLGWTLFIGFDDTHIAFYDYNLFDFYIFWRECWYCPCKSCPHDVRCHQGLYFPCPLYHLGHTSNTSSMVMVNGVCFESLAHSIELEMELNTENEAYSLLEEKVLYRTLKGSI